MADDEERRKEIRAVWAALAGIDAEGLEREIEQRAAQYKAELETAFAHGLFDEDVAGSNPASLRGE